VEELGGWPAETWSLSTCAKHVMSEIRRFDEATRNELMEHIRHLLADLDPKAIATLLKDHHLRALRADAQACLQGQGLPWSHMFDLKAGRLAKEAVEQLVTTPFQQAQQDYAAAQASWVETLKPHKPELERGVWRPIEWDVPSRRGEQSFWTSPGPIEKLPVPVILYVRCGETDFSGLESGLYDGRACFRTLVSSAMAEAMERLKRGISACLQARARQLP